MNLPMPSKATTSTAQLLDLLVVAWAIPGDAVDRWLPPGTRVDRLPGPDGSPRAFVEFRSGWRTDARWSALPGGWGECYRHAELRILVRANNQPGAAVLASWIDHSTLASALAPMSAATEEARVELVVDGNPASARCERIEATVRTERLRARVRAVADSAPAVGPWGPHDALAGFFLQRPVLVHPPRLAMAKPMAATVHHATPEIHPVRIVEAAIDHPLWSRIDPRETAFAGWAANTTFETGPFKVLKATGDDSESPETSRSSPESAAPESPDS